MKNPIEIVAEIGSAHNGDIVKAKELICAAAEAGADTVKFQMIFAREIIHPKTGLVPLPGGDIPLYERFKQLEQPLEFYQELKILAKNEGVSYLCTPFGIDSAKLCYKVDQSRIKIASPELNHQPLLKEIASYNFPVILSSGVSRLADIEAALHILTSKVTLLHCITAYPAPAEEYNLNLLPLYNQLFGIDTGVSDHSKDPIIVPLTALCCGARMVEKHISLSNTDTGLDDPIALPPSQFKRMASELRRVEKIPFLQQEEAVIDLIGKSLYKKVRGTGKKELAPSERLNYGRTNRSLHAITEIKPGMIFSHENTAVLRTEKLLNPGISPYFLPTILGKKAKKTIENGQGISWESLL